MLLPPLSFCLHHVCVAWRFGAVVSRKIKWQQGLDSLLDEKVALRYISVFWPMEEELLYSWCLQQKHTSLCAGHKDGHHHTPSSSSPRWLSNTQGPMVASIKELEFAHDGLWAIFRPGKHCHNLIDQHIQISALTSTSNVTPEFYLSLSSFCGTMWGMWQWECT